jgi:hypothetical protein
MVDLYLYAVVLFWLVFAAWDQYHVAKGREAMDAQLEADNAALDAKIADQLARWDVLNRKHATLDAACTDLNGRCWNCTEPHRVLELIDVGTRYELACPTCSELLKVRRGRREAA